MQKKFSYPIKIDELNQNQYRYVLTPDADETDDIRNILKVEEVRDFAGEIYLKLSKKHNRLRVWGKVRAQVKLKSVVSLEDFWKAIDAPFELIYDTKATYSDIRDLEASINDDIPDIIENGEINLADICIEQVALNLEDYPRAEGEVFDFEKYCRPISEEAENPFAVLKKLQK